MLTNYGYSISSNTLPIILSVEEFNQRTANKYVLDSRIESTIASATSTIRNYCGWHLATSVSCEIELTFDDLHIVRNGCDLLIQMPIRFFSSIDHIYLGATKEDGHWTGDTCQYAFKPNGIVKIYNAPIYNRYDKVVIQFTAGLTSDLLDGLKAIITQRVAHTLSGVNTLGINSESAGGVSISYNNTFVNNAKATALMSDEKEFLQPFKVSELL